MSKSNQPWAKAQDPEVAAPEAEAVAPEVTPAAPAEAEVVAPAAPVVEEVTVDMVTVTVPKPYKLRLDHSQEFPYKAGIQKMDRAHAEHWWSKANGVTIYDTNA